jgi:antitoxin (DNA-binding transcriptional repressor) of toxin-antitoxin stability system
MKATVVDLRYHMSEVIKALDRNERVSVLYHGKVKGVITPARGASNARVTSHPFFRMRTDAASVDTVMDDLRGGRHRDL